MSAYGALCKSLGYKYKNVIWNAGQLVTPNVATVDTTARIYDKELLERVRMQWQFGEWETLSEIDVLTVEQHPDRAKIALVVASAWLQLGDSIQARKFTQHAKEWGCDKKLIAQLLIAGVHNTLGRVASLNGDEVRAMTHFRDAVKGVSGDSKLASQVRITKEFARLEISDYSQKKMVLNNNSRNIGKIIVTGDIFRPLSQSANIDWLFSLIESPILAASNQYIQKSRLISVCIGDDTVIHSIYDLLNLEFSEDNWAEIYNRKISRSVKDVLKNYFNLSSDTFVIGFELSSLLKNYFDDFGVVYIDVRISPYRYLDDLLLSFSTNDSNILAMLEQYRVSDYTLNFYANMETCKRRNSIVDIELDALVFFGQTSQDASLIYENRFTSYKDYVDQIYSQKKKHSYAYYKPHPYEKNENAISFFEEIGFQITEANVYDLLSSNQLKTVMSLNSSVLHEAVFFKKSIVRLYQKDIYQNTVPVHRDFLSQKFWSTILNIHPIVNVEFPILPNQLRETLGIAWGKN